MKHQHSLGIVEKNSVDYIQAVFTALHNGQVVVPLRAQDDQQRMQAVDVSEVVVPASESGWFSQPLDLSDSSQIAHISFTSGTEGSPKGVFISCTALNDVVRRVQSLMQMDESVREYIGVPVYHSFGYGRCRHVASVGGQCYIPAKGFDPLELAQLLAQGKINALSLVPSLLRILLNAPQLLGDGRLRVKWLEIGSQAMEKAEKIAVKLLFPNAKIVQHYGLTEASRTTLLQIDEADEGSLDSVGKAYGSVKLRINGAGRICIQGKHVASSIAKEGQISDLVGDDGWFETTDLGRIEKGHLYFLGRADNVVNCGGQKLSTEVFEQAIINHLPEHAVEGEVVVSRVANPVYGEGFLISYNTQSDLGAIKPVAEACLMDLGIKAKNAIGFNSVLQIPKTPTGKVQHKALVQLFLEQNSANQPPLSSDAGKMQTLFSASLGVALNELNLGDCVNDIGIDSIQTVQLAIGLEAELGYLPIDWREQSIESLSKLPRKHAQSTDSKTDVATGKAPPLWDGSSNRNPEGMRFWGLLKEDFITHDRDIFSQGLFALMVNRFGNTRMGVSNKWLRFPLTLIYRILKKIAQVACGIKLDYTVQVGRRVKLEHFGGMILGARSIGDDTIIRQNTTFGIRDMSDLAAKPTIEQGVNIGAGAVIVGDITIGRYSVIGPNCVVTQSVPAFSMVSVAEPIVTVPDQPKS